MSRYSDIAFRESLRADPTLILAANDRTADPWQAAALRKRPRRLLLNCSRQSGKSMTTGTMAVDEVLHRADALVLLLSPSLRQSSELFRTVTGLYQALQPQIPKPVMLSQHYAEFANGARMVALPGADESTIRGFSSVTLLVIDEASRVTDALYRAVRPMIAVSKGRLIALSTPYGKRGFFYDEWTRGDGWERIKITAEQCPRMTAEFLSEERRSMPHAWFMQEYMCEFAEAEGAVFSYDDVMGALTENVEPLFAVERAETPEVKPLFAVV